jgi:transcriptional regulator with XRE-family HTH domain
LATRPEDIIAKQLGEKIRALREELGVPLPVFADVVHCAKSTLYRIETGDFLPNTELIMRIAGAFEVRVDDLLPTAYYRTVYAPPPGTLDFLARRAALPLDAAGREDQERGSRSSRRSSTSSKGQPLSPDRAEAAEKRISASMEKPQQRKAAKKRAPNTRERNTPYCLVIRVRARDRRSIYAAKDAA